MKLYNQNKDKIEDLKVIEGPNGETLYVNKLSDEVLNSLGYFRIQYESYPNRRYYKVGNETRQVVGNMYVIGYEAVDRPVEEVKELMFKDLKEAFVGYSTRPRIDTGLGFFVDGSRDDLENFKIGQEFLIPFVKDADGIMRPVTSADYDVIIQKIKETGISGYNMKWTKEEEINAFTTVSECELYENTPYDVEEPVLDETTLEPTGESIIVTKYKNNVKEWF